MKILQVKDKATGAPVATVPINEIQEEIITSLMASLSFRSIKLEDHLGRSWRALEAWARERAQELEAEERRELHERILAARKEGLIS